MFKLLTVLPLISRNFVDFERKFLPEYYPQRAKMFTNQFHKPFKCHATSNHYTRLSQLKVSAHVSRSYQCMSLLPVVENSPFVSWASFAGDSSEDTEFVFSGRLLRSRVRRLSLLPYLVQDKVKTTNHNRQKILNFPMANYKLYVNHVSAHHVGCWLLTNPAVLCRLLAYSPFIHICFFFICLLYQLVYSRICTSAFLN